MRLPLVLLLACPPISAARAQDSSETGRLRDYLERCERFGFAGSALVARGGRILVEEGFGLADRERGIPNSKETLFEIASATKSFTAVAILQLEAQGKLSTDDPIAKHLPEAPASARDITIYHLLTHTSGMPRAAAGGGEDLGGAVGAYLSAPRARKAGAAFEYWNGGYALLAGIVERASGVSYMEWCRRHIFEPAGMKRSGFTGEAGLQGAAVGYEGTEAPRRADEPPYGSYGWQYRGMGGLVTSVGDFYRFDRALRDDTLLPGAARAKLIQPFRESYACGFYVLDSPRLKIGHGGDVRGFHCEFSRFPKEDACIVLLCNVGGVPAWALAENLQALLFGDASRYPQPPRTERWSPEKLRSVAGTYEMAPDERILASVEGEGIRIAAEGVRTTALLSTSESGPAVDPDPELVREAQRIVEALAKGNVEPLRDRMNRGIPAGWPDMVKSALWPEHLRRWGRLERVRVTGASAVPGTTTVLLALDHDGGRTHVKVGFVADRLQILDLKGPDSLAARLVVPVAEDRLASFSWTGAPPPPIAVVRGANGNVARLRVEGRGGPITFQ
ncbi:MAG TPA: serine hydrolase domain-containing protein, partial [Planctomycetota bacterium]|nr:serine hydrolase domain-containing protein [Planctomycetota bacterium]